MKPKVINHIGTGLAGLNYLMAFLTLVFAPISPRLMTSAFFIWGASYLFEVLFNGRESLRFERRHLPLLALAILFLLTLVGSFYSDNRTYASSLAIHRFALIFVPMAGVLGLPSLYRLKPLLWAFVTACLASLVYLLALPWIDYAGDEGFRHLVWQHPRHLIRAMETFFHHSYYGVVQAMGWLAALYLTGGRGERRSRLSLTFLAAYAALIMAVMLVTGSRIMILAFLFMAACWGIARLWKTHRPLAIALTVAAVAAGLALWMWHPRFQSLHLSLAMFQGEWQHKEGRIGIWRCAMEVLGEHHQWLMGVGSGDLKDALMEKYLLHELDIETITARSHAHNTFLNCLVEGGLPTLLAWIATWALLPLSLPGRKAWSFYLLCPWLFLMMVEAIPMQSSSLIFYTLVLLMVPMLPKYDTVGSARTPAPKPLPRPLMWGLNTVTGLGFIALSALLIGLIQPARGYEPRDPNTYAQGAFQLVEMGEEAPSELQGCRGYRLDATAKVGYRPADKSYADHVTSFFLPSCLESRSGAFTVWCFISESFTGEEVLVRTASPLKRHAYQEKADPSLRDTWQRMEIRFDDLDPDIPIQLMFRHYGSARLDSLQGYVVFALPEFREL